MPTKHILRLNEVVSGKESLLGNVPLFPRKIEKAPLVWLDASHRLSSLLVVFWVVRHGEYLQNIGVATDGRRAIDLSANEELQVTFRIEQRR